MGKKRCKLVPSDSTTEFSPLTRLKIKIQIFIYFFLQQGTKHPCWSSSTKQYSESGAAYIRPLYGSGSISFWLFVGLYLFLQFKKIQHYPWVSI